MQGCACTTHTYYKMKTDREQLQEIAFQASDGTYFITDNYADELLKIYGYCGFPTVIREFVKAADWLSANPKRRKTKQAMSRFLTLWLFRYWNFTRGRLFKKKQ